MSPDLKSANLFISDKKYDSGEEQITSIKNLKKNNSNDTPYR